MHALDAHSVQVKFFENVSKWMKSSAHHIRKQAISAARGKKIVSLNKVRAAWILQLNNTILYSLVKHHAAHICPTENQIDKINGTCFEPVNCKILNQCLRAAYIFLTPNQLRAVNAENRRLYYCHQIENTVLRQLAKRCSHIRISRWNSVAKKQIDMLNELLCRPVVQEVLNAALINIGIAVDADQLSAIIEESVAHNKMSLYLSTRNAYEALQHDIAALNIKIVKKHFLSYLSLIINESALSNYSVNMLKNIVSIIKNPYMLAMKSIRLQAENLFQRRDVLSNTVETFESVALLKKINKLLSFLEKPSYQLLMRQQLILEKWARSNVVTDRLYREIVALAPKCVLRNDQANHLYETLRRKLTTKHHQ